MLKLGRLALLLAALVAAPSLAATTWTTTGAPNFLAATAVCTTGSESAPATVADGLSLGQLKAITVHVEAAGAMTSGATLQAYLWNPVTNRWNRVADGSLDLSVAAVQFQSFTGIAIVAGMGSRIAYVPVGLGVASSIYIVGG